MAANLLCTGNTPEIALNGTRMSAEDGNLAAGQTLGHKRYRLERKLGQGGMGMVWLATDTHLREEVALKLLPPEIQFDASALEDMRYETARSRRLSHSNIVRIHDLHEFPQEQPFISMEFVDGVSLAGLKSQQQQRCFPWEFVRPLIEQLCSALEYAHEEKLVHRDIKPSNIMLDDRGRLKLADFGIAAVASDSMSRVSLQGNTSGTPAYMSPQQMDGRTPRVTDDIYAMGATIYECLTSKPPFFRGDIPHQVRNLDPPTIEERLDEFGLKNPLPNGVDALIMACLAKDPDSRPQSAKAVVEWLGIGGEDAKSSSDLTTHVFGQGVPLEDSPSSKELTVLPPDEPTDPPAADTPPPLPDANATLPPKTDSKPHLTHGAELPYTADEPSRRKLPWKIVLGAFLVILFLGIIAKASRKRGNGNRSLANSPAAQIDDPEGGVSNGNGPAPWLQGEPTLIASGRFGAMNKLYEADSLRNCTVVVLEDRPGKTAMRRTITPWKPGNRFWSIDDGVIKASLRNEKPGRIKTYLVFNGLDLDTFFLAFAYRERTLDAEGNFGVFYRSQYLDDWSLDGYSVILGDDSVKLWGISEADYDEESQQLGPGIARRAMMEVGQQMKRMRLPAGGGHFCNIRAVGNQLGHMLDQQFGRLFQLNNTANKPKSGTIAIEAWLGGRGRLEVEFEGFLMKHGKQAIETLRPKKK